MKRLIEQHLKTWKISPRRKPLIVRGARQVGKTYSLIRFGQEYFDTVAFVDLERNPAWHRVFEEDLNPRRICGDLEILLAEKIVPDKTLLILDEIQACPRAITALRYFYEEMPELHVTAAGSLLEFAMGDISFPVGRIQFMHLGPLSFAEYLMAIGHQEAASIVLSPPVTVSNAIHEFLIKELRRYFFIGGMPESVATYKETNSMRGSFETQKEICETYRMDFAKYAPRADKVCLNNVLTSIARSIGRQIKYSRLADDYSNPTLKRAFELLCLADVAKKIPSTDPSALPLGVSASEKIFKALLVDIGLMRHLSGMPIEVEYEKPDLLAIYRGAMAEQFAGQEITLAQKNNLYYWSRRVKSSSAEIDYLAVVDDKILPVEVKSGPAGKLKSMHIFLRQYPATPKGIILSTQPYAELPDQKLTFVPLYFTFSATGGTGQL